MIEADRTQMII